MNNRAFKIFKDGDQWCILCGEDYVIGVAGFGDTIKEAITDFCKVWLKEINSNNNET